MYGIITGSIARHNFGARENFRADCICKSNWAKNDGNFFFVGILSLTDKKADPQWDGSADPDAYQNVTDPQHRFKALGIIAEWVVQSFQRLFPGIFSPTPSISGTVTCQNMIKHVDYSLKGSYFNSV